MATVASTQSIAERYEAAAQEYLRRLPLEHFMEAIPQATQREITLASLALLEVQRPDVHVFNELLVQYPLPQQRRPGQVVPDNMVVISTEPIKAEGSFNLPVEPARPFWVLEYVSKSSTRKDYEDNFDKYEQHLKVPYYLIFQPENQEMTLYHHQGTRYVAVKPNKHGRYEIPELDLEVALEDGWVRFWHRGELLPLPAEMWRELDKTTRRADDATRRADDLQRRLLEAEQELANLRAQTQRSMPGPNGPKSTP
jgi:Uma2 family endonuclease